MLRKEIFISWRTINCGLRLAAQKRAPWPRFITSPVVARTAQPSMRFSRWYSSKSESKEPSKEESVENKAETEAAEAKTEAEVEMPDPNDELRRQIAEKDAQIIDLKDRYLRQVAEYRNLQERTKRDMKAAREFAISAFGKDLIASIDNLDRALANIPAEKLKVEESANTDLINFYEGIKMIETVLMQALEKHGLERLDPIGEPFNANEHEATFMVPMPEKEDGTVFHVQSKGFRLNGRILRAAKVGVVKNE